MKLFGLSASAASLALVASFLPACAGSGDDSNSSGTMFIETCSLGCSSGQGGFQVNCSIVQAFLNQEISITFSQAVAASSVNSQSFQLIDEISGQVPVGTRFVDPSDPRKVIFRPSITFDEQGSPSYGFTENTTYRITIPGTQQHDTGPFIKSTGNKPNKSRMQCDIHTTDEVVDAVPGQPTVTVLVDTQPNDSVPGTLADGAVDVPVESKIVFLFNDLMNPATLANPVTHQPASISVKVDNDGNLLTTDDQVPLFGDYIVDIDLNLLATKMVYTPANGLPGGGDPSLHPTPRKVLVTLPVGVQDLAMNPIANPGIVSFTPEIIDLDPAILPDADGENFTDTNNLDADLSGAEWGGGRLTRGYGGGSGRLGQLYLRAGTSVTLNTDNQVFPLTAAQGQTALADILDNYVAPADPTPQVTITDGQFEFSSLVIDPGATLKITGSNPARVFSRGPLTIFGSGRVDARGQTPVLHDSSIAPGQAGGAGGPAGGAGGKGGDRMEAFGTNLLGTVGGIDFGNDNAVTPVLLDGQNAVGVGGDTDLARGLGGVHFPNMYPGGTNILNGLTTTWNELLSICASAQVGSPGSGGGYSTNGEVSMPASSALTDWAGQSTLAPPTSPGMAEDVDLEDPDPESNHFKRKLPWEAQLLRGGAGGGGGGGCIYGTLTGGTNINPGVPECSDETAPGQGIQGPPDPGLRDNSAAGGGGGGGAIQLISGREFLLAGQVLATGGAGGSSLLVDPDPPNLLGRKIRATPGGGGSGGGVKLQALTMLIDLTPGSYQVVITGGGGGTNTLGALGGKGGNGLVRIEDTSGSLTRVSESPKVDPFDPDHLNPTTNLPESEQWVSVGGWMEPRARPDSYSAAVSCWMRPSGNFFQLEFGGDDLSDPDPEQHVYGWNMDVIYDDGSGEVLIAYRGPDPALPFEDDFETVIGNQLNHDLPDGTGSYLAVRFQGVVANGTLPDLCDVELSGTSSQIVEGSLTPWVRHPAELNALSPRPNMIRFTVVFDRSLALNQAQSPGYFIQGVTNLKIRTQPD